MDPNILPSTSFFNDKLEKKQVMNNHKYFSKRDEFLNKEMRNELIQVLAEKEARRIFVKNNLKAITKILEKHQTQS